MGQANGRGVLVTGGTRGLGLEICRRLIGEGYEVVATGRSLSDGLRQLSEENPQSVHFEALDLQETEQLNQFAKNVAERLGSFYGLVNNAAVAHDGILATLHDSEIRNQIRVNVEGTLLLTKYVVRQMLVGEEARIVNISSIVARKGFRGLVAYAASKGAVEAMTHSLARELGREDITVNAVAPGYMDTDMTASLGDDALNAIAERSALNRLASISDVAAAVSFLLSGAAASLTGVVLPVDAGRSA